MTRRTHRLLLAGITAVAAILRLGWARYANHRPEGLFDPARYLGYANAIADGDGMVEWTGHATAYYPPGYPWFAGIVTWLGSPLPLQPWTTILIVQALIGAGTCLLGARIAGELRGRTAAVIAAAVLALYPNLIFHSGVMLGETLFNALFLGFLAVLVPMVRTGERHGRNMVAAGLLLGLAVMVRPISLAVLPVVALVFWLRDRDLRSVLRTTGIITLLVLVCIAPWTIRNSIRMGSLVPISTNTGENLCIGNHPDADGAFTLSEHCRFGDVLASPADEVEVDRKKTRYAIGRIVRDPGRQVWLVWRRFWFTWVRDGDHDGIVAAQSYNTDRWMNPDIERPLIRLADTAYVLVLVAAAGGAVRSVRRRRPEDLLVLGATIMIAAVPLAFFGDSRFKVPAIPLLIVIAAGIVGTGPAEAEPLPETPEPDDAELEEAAIR